MRKHQKENRIMTQDNKYYPGGCSVDLGTRPVRPEGGVVDVYTQANSSFPLGTEPLQVPEKLYTKKELDAAVDIVADSFTRIMCRLQSEVSYLDDQNRDMNLNYREAREEIEHLNDRVATLQDANASYDKSLKAANAGWSLSVEYSSKLLDKIRAYATLVHAREYVRKQKAMTSSFGYYYGVDKAQSILTNALIDMEG
jgi:FtsZ-binding cell division protein ZapB